jgi:hypothetical protein
MKDFILRNRYTLLLATLTVYMVVLVAEGMITGREARLIEFENPYFDFNMNEFEGFRERRSENDDEDVNSSVRFDDSGDV